MLRGSIGAAADTLVPLPVAHVLADIVFLATAAAAMLSGPIRFPVFTGAARKDLACLSARHDLSQEREERAKIPGA